jgi:hypothetical protein
MMAAAAARYFVDMQATGSGPQLVTNGSTRPLEQAGGHRVMEADGAGNTGRGYGSARWLSERKKYWKRGQRSGPGLVGSGAKAWSQGLGAGVWRREVWGGIGVVGVPYPGLKGLADDHLAGTVPARLGPGVKSGDTRLGVGYSAG